MCSVCSEKLRTSDQRAAARGLRETGRSQSCLGPFLSRPFVNCRHGYVLSGSAFYVLGAKGRRDQSRGVSVTYPVITDTDLHLSKPPLLWLSYGFSNQDTLPLITGELFKVQPAEELA